MGKILAVAHFIGDFNVIGRKGNNIGFKIIDKTNCENYKTKVNIPF